MNIVSYNVNGIRAALRKGFYEWLKSMRPEVVCLQEIKAYPQQINQELFHELGYHTYWQPAEKKGYSGTAILALKEPVHVEKGCGMHNYDREGRVIRADFEDYSVLNVYMPSGSSSDDRQQFKMQWLKDFFDYVQKLREDHPNLIICGDYNICHLWIDIHNPQDNQKTSGFLPEEREWMTKLFNHNFIDTFRYFNQDPHQYTWWSYRARSRERNKGWRIDYQVATSELENRLKRCEILNEAEHSDHCPVLLELA